MAIEFWPMRTVLQRVGLSKSEIYRQINSGLFPAGRSYKDNPKKKFWLSNEVVAWQAKQVGIGVDDFEALLG